MNAQCFRLSSQSGQTQIPGGQKHWCCAGGRRWCGAGNPSALMVLLCVWCVAGIGARAHQVSDEERYSIFILRPPTLVRMRVRVRIRVHVTGGVLARGLTYVGRLREQPHWRWPNQGAAVAKVALSALKSRRGAARQSAATSMAGFLMNFSSAAVEL